jgi:hypothetical protein
MKKQVLPTLPSPIITILNVLVAAAAILTKRTRNHFDERGKVD